MAYGRKSASKPLTPGVPAWQSRACFITIPQELDATDSGPKMALFTVFLFIGAPLGVRFRVLVLIPAIILTVVTAGGFEMAQHQGAWSSALTTIAAVIAMQMGYLGGACVCVVAARAMTAVQKALGPPRLGFHRWFARSIHP